MAVETLKAACDSLVVIHHHGAHITTWKNSAGRDIIYTSPDAIYDGKKAIRGGVPICFPQFGKKGDLRQHGFARNMPWKVDKSFESPSNGSAVRFILENTEETLSSSWPFQFYLAYTVFLSEDGNSLVIDVDVTNKDGRSFPFTMALHSYFACDPEKTSLPDFENVDYMDSVHENSEGPGKQKGPTTFGKEVDRVYMNTPDVWTIPSANLVLRKTNLPDAVVWNPYVDKSAGMSDLPDDGWKHFVCVEPGRIVEPVVVEPKEVWSCKVELFSDG